MKRRHPKRPESISCSYINLYIFIICCLTKLTQSFRQIGPPLLLQVGFDINNMLESGFQGVTMSEFFQVPVRREDGSEGIAFHQHRCDLLC